MNLVKKSLAAVALLGSVSGANAAIYYSDELSGSPLDFLYYNYSWDNDTQYSGSFSNLFQSIDWGANDLVKAVIMFGFADDESDGAEVVSAKAGSDWADLYLEDGDPHPVAAAKDLDVTIEDSVALEVEVNGSHGGGFDYREAELGGQALEDIKNGSLAFKVKREDGDVYVKTVQLKIETAEKQTPPPVKVPDSGATLILLGAALGGLAAVRRKLGK